jgi:flavin-dependent dehydrogenase
MTYDLIVVGGGPSGSVLAGLCSGYGLRVLLLDAARFPRPKPCGECLNPGAVAALHRIGLMDLVHGLSSRHLTGWRLVVHGRAYDLDFPGTQSAVSVRRLELDHALLGWAGAQGAAIFEATKVTDLVFEADRVNGVRVLRLGRHQSLYAHWVAGADGLRSTVVRRLGLLASPGTSPKVAITAHWRGVEGLGPRGELHFAAPFVLGIAPLHDDEANITLVMPAHLAKHTHKEQQMVLARWRGIRERFRGAQAIGAPLATGPFDQPVKAVQAPGALLVGDAAGYFDPLTGQGVYRALRSAELAAATLIAAAEGESEQAVRWRYEVRLQCETKSAYRLQRLIDMAAHRPIGLKVSLTLMHLVPPLGRWLMGRVGDCGTSGFMEVGNRDADV